MEEQLCIKCYKKKGPEEFILDNGKISKRCKICRDQMRQYYNEYRKKSENFKEWQQTNGKECQKKYYLKNKDKVLMQKRKYREVNSEKLNEKSKQYRIQHLDKIHQREKEYREINNDKIKERQKKYREEHKDEIKEKDKKYNGIKIECVCGGHYVQRAKLRHEKSKKHQKYIQQDKNIEELKDEKIEKPKHEKEQSCECGSTYVRNHARHERSMRHQNYLKQQNE